MQSMRDVRAGQGRQGKHDMEDDDDETTTMTAATRNDATNDGRLIGAHQKKVR